MHKILFHITLSDEDDATAFYKLRLAKDKF